MSYSVFFINLLYLRFFVPGNTKSACFNHFGQHEKRKTLSLPVELIQGALYGFNLGLRYMGLAKGSLNGVMAEFYKIPKFNGISATQRKALKAELEHVLKGIPWINGIDRYND